MNSNTNFPLISLFEMPFPVWRHACKTGRKNISKHLPPGQTLPELSEEDYRLWYARYLNHIAKNYHEFLEGIMSGFPEPQYPPEVQDMIINYKIKMSINSGDALGPSLFRDGSTFHHNSIRKVKHEMDDEDRFMERDRGSNAVVIEYGHHKDSDVDIGKRKIEDYLVDYNTKKTRVEEFSRGLSRETAHSSSIAVASAAINQINGTPPGYSFKSEDEFKYKVKALILYYLDKELLAKGLIDAHTKKAKLPETTLPNPYASQIPIHAPIGSSIDLDGGTGGRSPSSYSDRDPPDRRRSVRERLGPSHDRFHSSSNPGSERSGGHTGGRGTDYYSNKRFNERRSYSPERSSNYSRSGRGRGPGRGRGRDPRDPRERREPREPRERKPEDDASTVTTVTIVPKPNSSCEKCRNGEECWDC